jgi:hypothetical protein
VKTFLLAIILLSFSVYGESEEDLQAFCFEKNSNVKKVVYVEMPARLPLFNEYYFLCRSCDV